MCKRYGHTMTMNVDACWCILYLDIFGIHLGLFQAVPKTFRWISWRDIMKDWFQKDVFLGFQHFRVALWLVELQWATRGRGHPASPIQWKKELPMPYTSCKCDPVLLMLQTCFASPDIPVSRGFGGTSWQEARKLHFSRTSASSKSQKASKVPWVSTISSQPKYLKYLPRVENIDTAKENAPHSSSLPASRKATFSHFSTSSSATF